MWIVCAIFGILWVVGIQFYFSPVLIITFFAGMIGSAAVALIPARDSKEYERE